MKSGYKRAKGEGGSRRDIFPFPVPDNSKIIELEPPYHNTNYNSTP